MKSLLFLVIFLAIKRIEACSLASEMCECVYAYSIRMSCTLNNQNGSNILDIDALNINTVYISNKSIDVTIQNKVYSRMKNSSINNLLWRIGSLHLRSHIVKLRASKRMRLEACYERTIFT